jgi:hypothetical protein
MAFTMQTIDLEINFFSLPCALIWFEPEQVNCLNFMVSMDALKPN